MNELNKHKDQLSDDLEKIKSENKKLSEILMPAGAPRNGYESLLALFIHACQIHNSDFIDTISVNEWSTLTKILVELYKSFPKICDEKNKELLNCKLYNVLTRINKKTNKVKQKSAKAVPEKRTLQDIMGISESDLSNTDIQGIGIVAKGSADKLKTRKNTGKLSRIRNYKP